MATARPRPRPVPRVKPTPAAASSSTQEPSPVTVVAAGDDDAMFVRNKGRSAQTWNKLDKMTRAKPKTVRSDTEGDSDSPPPKKQRKKKVAAGSTEAKIQRLMSETMSDKSGSDSDVEVTSVSGTPVKRKKRRSRSRSITPPPSVAKHQLLAARELVRKALNGTTAPRAPSPTFDDPDVSTDTIIFDPELQKIARSAAAEVQRASSSEPVEGDPTDTLEITVKWKPHPQNENGKASTAVFKINRSDTFEELFAAIADDEGILPDNVVMAYRGVRVYPSVTSAVLKLWVDAEFTACTKNTWDYIKANPGAGASNPTQQNSDIEISDAEEPMPTNAGAASMDESDAESEGGETFKLCLRSAVTKKDIFLTVRPTTTCGAIVQAFLKKAGLADQYGSGKGGGGRKSVGGKGKGKKAQPEKEPQLVIDGDKMAADVPISDADLDDGDVVDVFLP
ncbi:hypothetical protein FB45DRAFT_283993 [Roridomyces roridus]|uniref:Rad60/SUMO-like domain-containing protein n=1 Tax=Roridomyces roridus TaxID=1738132 RepID=A0AAD7CCV2_9AGAR|nr:hypothetical protein FB45DRAFT_283993 [Roridomyces roridus]